LTYCIIYVQCTSRVTDALVKANDYITVEGKNGYEYTTQNLLSITFSTVCYFCVFVINMEIDLKELNIISASCTWQIDNLSTQ